jgi:hypothetical protein
MLDSDDWHLRAAACEILADHLAGPTVAALVPRCSDADWRVRAAAFSALSSLAALPEEAVFQNVPLARREQILLAWLDDYDRSPGQSLRRQLCELYADSRYVEVGAVLTDRCLDCHVGLRRAPPEASGVCAACHRQIHEDWAGSSHANSLTHLRLMTADPDSRQVRPMDFGPLRGMNCTECHVPDGGSPATGWTEPASRTSPSSRPAKCPFVFDSSRPPAEACRRCHGSTYQQWLSWRQGPQPALADWPPGQLDLKRRGDRRTCVGCHMPAGPSPAGQPLADHRWLARRNVPLQRQGLHVEFRPDSRRNQGQAVLVLTNLSGHAYPTGTCRRGLEILTPAAPPAGRTAESSFRRLAMLSLPRPGAPWSDNQPALEPGEQRSFLLAATPGQAVPWQVLYVRDLYQDSYTAELFSSVQADGQ